jgi:hypothetical protein
MILSKTPPSASSTGPKVGFVAALATTMSRHEPLLVGLDAGVGDDGVGLAAGGDNAVGGLLDGLPLPRRDDDVGAGLGEGDGDGLADAPGGAGDDRGAAIETKTVEDGHDGLQTQAQTAVTRKMG